MSVFWKAKIWGLLHDPALKALHNNFSGRGENSFWEELDIMKDWVDNKLDPEKSGKIPLQHIHLADYIASASDRGAIGSVTASVNYGPKDDPEKGLEIAHLLSGEKLELKLRQHPDIVNNRKAYLNDIESQLKQEIPPECQPESNADIKTIKRLYWWLWRCLPEATVRAFEDESLLLMPAETRLPDSSIWSHASVTSALAGALAGCHLTAEDLIQNWSAKKTLSHPYLVSFSFSPIQELIKASRKMRDFWAGSWTLHYLSAAVSWQLANRYGPDSLLYPSLFQQPLIDRWLLKAYPEFKTWVKTPGDRQLLTAGFPNVLVLILPKSEVEAAMQTARQTLIETWRNLGGQVLAELQQQRRWMRNLSPDSNSWKGWLDAQWQTYWSAIPIGVEGEKLKSAAIPAEQKADFDPWVERQNNAYNLTEEKRKLFQVAEIDLLRKAYEQRLQKQGRRFSVNIGSWWPYIFDQTRLALATVKNARTWEIPTAFGPRSTISGLGPVVHPGKDWIAEGETQNYWRRDAGLFDGIEQLNATETVKRGLEKILPNLLETPLETAGYPDLTAGVAGYLKVNEGQPKVRQKFQKACEDIRSQDWVREAMRSPPNKWGIPWIDEDNPIGYHPRLLNAGWLVEDADTPELRDLEGQMDGTDSASERDRLKQEILEIKKNYRAEIQTRIDRHYPGNNPADWYVLAAGDGDGMSEWLKGKKLESYGNYTPEQLQVTEGIREEFAAFLELPKRMGPATHNALSRALLDFSNQLVPYLTEGRYAGRLIYGGGDDVLAYLNLWEWDRWLWDIHECFRGEKDPKNEFDDRGDYWQWRGVDIPPNLAKRPLFTMGKKATISFGIVIAHHSVPLAIALENLWEAEEEAKEHETPDKQKKDAVQGRVIFGNGNLLKATTKFDTFHRWHRLLEETEGLESSLFEQAASLWIQHPCPVKDAIAAWTRAFCDRRDFFAGKDELKRQFQTDLTDFLKALWETTPESDLTAEVQNWLKLAAFVLRNRKID